MKIRFWALTAIFIFLTSVLTIFPACNSADSTKIKVVCTIFPEYDWVREITISNEERFELTLLGNGADMHNYQATVSDLAKISTADLFIYVGGESDEWVEKALANPQNKSRKEINLLSLLGNKALEEEEKEGMAEETEPDAEPETDEHVWLSIRNAQMFVSEIANTLGEIDSSKKQLYQTNATNYNKKLNTLDGWFAKEVQSKQTSLAENEKITLLFGDRFPFRYLTNDYGLDYYAAFKGCSAESEVTVAKVPFLAEKVDELNIKIILKIETSTDSVAKAIKNNTTNKNQEILTLNSMQNTTLAENQTYFSIMVENFIILTQAIQ